MLTCTYLTENKSAGKIFGRDLEKIKGKADLKYSFFKKLFQFFIRYFLHLHFKYYPESPLYLLHTLLPYPPTPNFWPWCSLVLGI